MLTPEAWRFFLKDIPAGSDDLQILLSTIIDENGNRQGVLAQLLGHQSVDKYMELSRIEDLTASNSKPKEKNSSVSKKERGSAKKEDKVAPHGEDEKHQQLSHRHRLEDALPGQPESQPRNDLQTKKARQTKDTASQQTNGQGQEHQTDTQQTLLFSKFAELLPNGLAILDKEAEAIFVNDGFFKLTTNKGQNEFRAWPESIHPEDYERVMGAYRQAFSSREELRIEFRCAADSKGEEGEWRLFLFRPLSDDAEAGFICAVVDITEIKQAQITQEKAATEAQERKEQQERFIDMVSHEIRNPLSAVLHLAEEVKEVARDIGDNHGQFKTQIDDILDAADTILLCVSHQNTLVDDILSFSKLDSMMLSLVPRGKSSITVLEFFF